MHIDGTLSGDPPTARHYRDCGGGHFTWTGRSEPLGEPVPATEEQMRTLPACKNCIGRGEGADVNSTRESRHGKICPTCQQQMPLTGICDFCG